jgi:hypothetical protein
MSGWTYYMQLNGPIGTGLAASFVPMVAPAGSKPELAELDTKGTAATSQCGRMNNRCQKQAT